MTSRRAFYVLSTHWDREWHAPFQDFRYRLVGLLDQVLDALEDGRLRGPFQTDGQAIMLEDYLEVRPERRRQVAEFVRQGKLVIGPWYTLPDEFLASGESLVRNLQRGRSMARAFGGAPSDAGFLCDMFGHNSQMPQILAGFGIRGGFIWRGANVVEQRNLRWRGADGSELACYRFGQFGYCTFACRVRRVAQPAHPYDAAEGVADLRAYLQAEAQATEVDPLLVFDGCDHIAWDERAYAGILHLMQHPIPDVELVHGSLDDYLAAMLPSSDRITTVLEGELREPGQKPVELDYQDVIPGVLSSRAWIKQANAECQTLLCQWAEPLSACANLALRSAYPAGFLDVAWGWLLANHAHDSICGCSVDAVHQDMAYRFAQARQIGHRLAVEAAHSLAQAVAGELADQTLRVVVFNPCPRPFDEVAEVTLQVPAAWPAFNEFFGYEPKPAFRIYDATGSEIPYQRIAQRMHRGKVRTSETKVPEREAIHEVDVCLRLRIPALGYTALTVRSAKPHTIPLFPALESAAGTLTRHPETPAIAAGERTLANEFLSCTIEPNGTLTLLDKRTGRAYPRLLTFEDGADIGDGWYHGQAVNDQVFMSSGSACDIALIHNGPLSAAFRVRTTLRVPADFQFDSMTRSERLVDLVIDSMVRLRAGADRVEVRTTVHNNADDHRLRVLLPSGTAAQSYLTDTPFDVVERPVALRPDNHLYRELEVETKPQQSWTAVYDERGGLAVVSAGMMETAVRDLPERPIALTLFRGTRRTPMTDGEPGGEVRGPMTFAYWIVPLAGEPDRACLCEMGQQLAAGLRDAQLAPQDVGAQRSPTALPATAGLLEVHGPVVLTSVRRHQDGLDVRMFNPASRPVDGAIRLGALASASGLTFSHAQLVDLESRPIEPARDLVDGCVTLSLKPKQIITVAFQTCSVRQEPVR